jgi:hypothetical protein
LNDTVFDAPVLHAAAVRKTLAALLMYLRAVFLFHRFDGDVCQLNAVPHTHFPSGHYRHRRHTLDLNKFLPCPVRSR